MSARYLTLLVLVVGTGSLGAEIAAARLMSPFFGDSTIVWANTIGVVLVALSIGYWLGGKLSDRRPELPALCAVILVASVLIALIPFVAQPLFNASVSALDEISAGTFIGSFFGVLALVAVPVVLLGTASPWALRLAVSSVRDAGKVAGRLYAVSTIGSLLGTMLSALLLIPFLGTQRTFICFALVIGLVAALGLRRRWLVVPALIAAALAIPVGTLKSQADGEIVFEDESEHQYIRVIDRDDGSRILELNEGQAVHSLMKPGTVLTGDVWDGYLVLPFTRSTEPPERIAILGNAAGTTARAYGEYFPDTVVDAVEIDPELQEVGREYFDMGSNENLTVFNEDARPWLRSSEGGYDAILVDAYHQPYIPFYLTTTEFFAEAKEKLAPGGVVMVNAGHPEGSDDLETVLGRTMNEVFANVARDPIEPTNTILLGSDGEISAETLREAAEDFPPELESIADASAYELGPRLPGGTVYTDDKAPVEWLIDASILGYAAEQ
ncbi:fused MFS/spermidine synthase [Thermoleophilia bacterium SCSIO 60948]|nr:fused MFS/spermidine synthase [Thermoleophilia bacterium SCSIO 60948]